MSTDRFNLGGMHSVKRSRKEYEEDDDVVVLETGPKLYYLWLAYKDKVSRLGEKDRLADKDMFILNRLWSVYVQLCKIVSQSPYNVALLTATLYKKALDDPAGIEMGVFKAIGAIRQAKTSAEMKAARDDLDTVIGLVQTARPLPATRGGGGSLSGAVTGGRRGR